MLLYLKQDGDIFNLDNLIRIYPYGDEVRGKDISGNNVIITSCDNDNMAEKIVYDLYKKMTYGNENMILDLEEYREEAKKDVNEEK